MPKHDNLDNLDPERTPQPVDPAAMLVGYLRNLTADGKLSGEEVWSLGNWLNEHPAAAKVWPGDALVEPLERAFADASLEVNEMVEIADLIASIERQWSALHPPATPPAETDRFESPRACAIVLPTFALALEVPSVREDYAFEVRLDDQSCTCPEWQKRRAFHPVGDLSRVCKHLATAYVELTRRGRIQTPEVALLALNACVAAGRGLGIGGHWLSFEVDGQPIVVGRGERPWWDVYVQEQGIGTRFGYNAEEQRWAYGAVPRSAGTIRQVVHGTSATR